jgi:hypothetical protein
MLEKVKVITSEAAVHLKNSVLNQAMYRHRLAENHHLQYRFGVDGHGILLILEG